MGEILYPICHIGNKTKPFQYYWIDIQRAAYCQTVDLFIDSKVTYDTKPWFPYSPKVKVLGGCLRLDSAICYLPSCRLHADVWSAVRQPLDYREVAIMLPAVAVTKSATMLSLGGEINWRANLATLNERSLLQCEYLLLLAYKIHRRRRNKVTRMQGFW